MKAILIAIVISFLLSPSYTTYANWSYEAPAPRLPINESRKIVSQFIGEVSAYNVGDVNQNDDSPCIGAFNEDLCKAVNGGELVFANNYYKKGTIVCIESVGCGRVADRMNFRYGKENFDIAMKFEDKKIALNFGRQNLQITVYKK